MPTKKVITGAQKAKAPSSELPIEEYKHFVYWLEGFRDEPGPLGLTADAALSSLGAFTMLLSDTLGHGKTSFRQKK